MSFVDTHDFPVGLVLRVLDIAASTYYEWRARRTAPSQRAREDAELLALVDEIRGAHEFAATYGSPRVWLE
jgi:putative transposase